jgi:hypothetical protein
VGKLAKSLSDRAVAVNLGPYSDTIKILTSLEGLGSTESGYTISMFFRRDNDSRLSPHLLFLQSALTSNYRIRSIN